jgi:nitroreductase
MLDMLQQRRSIRQFKDRPVEEEKLSTLLEATLRAPSSRGRNPWEFVVVTDAATREALPTCKAKGAGFLAGAPLVIAVCADPEVCDVWIEDCSIAAITLQYTAESLGLASCWAQLRLRQHADGRDAEAVARESLKLPESFRVPCIIGIGYPDQQLAGHPRNELPWHKLHEGKLGHPFKID